MRLSQVPNKVVNRNQIAALFYVRFAYNTKPLHNLVRLQRRYGFIWGLTQRFGKFGEITFKLSLYFKVRSVVPVLLESYVGTHSALWVASKKVCCQHRQQ